MKEPVWVVTDVKPKNDYTLLLKLSDEEMDRLALMFEIAPRLADAYRLKNEFREVIRSDSSKIGKPCVLTSHLL